MSNISTINGIIISTKILKNNTFQYLIKDDKGITDKYTFFTNNSKNIDGLDNTRHLTIKYESKYNEKYGKTNIIKEFIYGKYITDVKTIADFLINKINNQISR